MFQDIILSEQNMRDYAQECKKSKMQFIEMDFHILTQVSWPITVYQKAVQLPKQIADSQSNFELFYRKTYKGRKLNWSIDHCSALVKANISEGNSCQLECSGIQALILLELNQNLHLKLQELMMSTNLSEDQLKVGLLSLSIGDQNLLIRAIEHRGQQVSKDETFTFNESFTSKLKRININKIPKSEKRIKEEIKQADEKIKEDRRFQIDAVIMKIMKEKKTLGHNDLLSEIFQKINFPSDSAFIKTRIESLIDKDYIKRSANDASIYEYIA